MSAGEGSSSLCFSGFAFSRLLCRKLGRCAALCSWATAWQQRKQIWWCNQIIVWIVGVPVLNYWNTGSKDKEKYWKFKQRSHNVCCSCIVWWSGQNRLSHLSIAPWWSGLGAPVGVGWQLSVPLNPLSVSGETIPSCSTHSKDIASNIIKQQQKKQGF